MKSASVCMLLCSGCFVQSGQSGWGRTTGGPGSQSVSPAPGADDRAVAAPDGNGRITVPDVFGLPRERAEALLRQAGYRGAIAYDDSQCQDSVIHGQVIEQGIICYQTPIAGRVQGPQLPITLVVQRENPWHGNEGKVTEWRLMPKIVGMKLDDARADMKRVGFSSEDNVDLELVDDPACAPNVVCAVYPAEMSRAGVHSTKTIRAGRDPNAAAASVAASSEAAAGTSSAPPPAGPDSRASVSTTPPPPTPAVQAFF